jgi:hypothetical protein
LKSPTIKILQNSVNIKDVVKEIKEIIKKYHLHDLDQISLQSYKESAWPDSEWSVGTGRFRGLPEGITEKDFKYPLFEEAEVINHYMKKMYMYRTRIMILNPRNVMSIHEDFSPRIHIPIKTNSDCRMIIGDQCHHLEVGKIYWTDTTIKHTAFNAGTRPRIHIMGCVDN